MIDRGGFITSLLNLRHMNENSELITHQTMIGGCAPAPCDTAREAAMAAGDDDEEGGADDVNAPGLFKAGRCRLTPG